MSKIDRQTDERTDGQMDLSTKQPTEKMKNSK